MYTAHTSALPFKDNRLRNQAPTWASTLARTSNQFRSSWRSGPNYTPRMQTGPGRGHPLPNTQSQTFALLKVDFGTCHLLVPLGRLLLCHYVQMAGHENSDIIGVRGDFSLDAASQRNSTQGRTYTLIPKPAEQELQSKDIEKRGQGGNPAELNVQSRKPSNASRSPAPPPADCGTEC